MFKDEVEGVCLDEGGAMLKNCLKDVKMADEEIVPVKIFGVEKFKTFEEGQTVLVKRLLPATRRLHY
jgi:hypothetical protein